VPDLRKRGRPELFRLLVPALLIAFAAASQRLHQGSSRAAAPRSMPSSGRSAKPRSPRL